MRRWFAGLIAALSVAAFFSAPPVTADAGTTPIGKIGQPLRVEFKGIIADITVGPPMLAAIPPGFGYPPRPPRQQVWRSQVTVTAVRVPNPWIMSKTFSFRGVTGTGDSYLPRTNDAPDDLQFALQNAPQGSTVSGGVWWDCYRDLVSTVVLISPQSGFHLGQWSM